MKLNIFYIILISCTILSSCEKDNQVTIPNTNTPLLSKVLLNGSPYYEYSYNDANLISAEKNNFYYIKYNYDNRNRLLSSDYYFDFSMDSLKRKVWVNPGNTALSLSKTFEYNNNDQISRIIFNRPLGNNSEFSEFTYANGRISRQTMYLENKISGHIDYLYDGKGNLIKQVKYVLASGNDELMTTTFYEYDNMQNPYRSFDMVMNPWINTSQNNIVKETYTIDYEVAKSVEKVQITANTYDYNDKGYPIRSNGTFQYIYR